MNLGFFTMPIHPLDKSWRQCLQEDREAFVLADELGFTEGYVGEHVTDKAENITSCAMFIASLVEQNGVDSVGYRHDQHAEQPPRSGGSADCDARSSP